MYREGEEGLRRGHGGVRGGGAEGARRAAVPQADGNERHSCLGDCGSSSGSRLKGPTKIRPYNVSLSVEVTNRRPAHKF